MTRGGQGSDSGSVAAAGRPHGSAARLVTAAIAGSREWGISPWDALIVRAAEAAGCRRLVTEDLAHGAVYGSVRVENPFRT